MRAGAYLRSLAQAFFKVRGDAAYPSLPAGERAGSPARNVPDVLARERWRWLAFALPPDLLLGALDRGGGPGRVEVLSPLLERWRVFSRRGLTNGMTS